MTALEILLAWWSNLTVVLVIATIGLVLGGGAMVAASFDTDIMGKDAGPARTWGMRAVMVGVLTALLACVPSVDDLWKVRVGLLKLELASPENVKAAGGHIEEIVKALECKYLNVNCKKEEAK